MAVGLSLAPGRRLPPQFTTPICSSTHCFPPNSQSKFCTPALRLPTGRSVRLHSLIFIWFPAHTYRLSDLGPQSAPLLSGYYTEPLPPLLSTSHLRADPSINFLPHILSLLGTDNLSVSLSASVGICKCGSHLVSSRSANPEGASTPF